jgi:signal transduction histidine kinase
MIGNRIFAIKGDVNELGFLASEPVLDIESIRSLQKSLSVNVMRVEEILNDFRDFVSATQIQKQPIDMNALVRETVEEVFPKRSPIQLVLTLNELPPVLADDRRLRRAISELIENSLHHISDGQLSVTTQLTPDGEYVRIVIADTGPGIEPERKETIFQPFYSGRAKGMGLGLSIVKGILEAHGGNATEEGVLGQGARFVLVLPA